MSSQEEHKLYGLHKQLDSYKKSYLKSLFVKGAFYALLVCSSLFVLYCILEYFIWLPTWVRTGLFYSYIAISLFFIWKYVIKPFIDFIKYKEKINNLAASYQISQSISELKDQLINTVQLSEQADSQNAFVQASINQKYSQIEHITFTNSIDWKEPKRIVAFFFLFIGFGIGLSFIWPKLYVEGAKRIILHNQHFSAPAPFDFIVNNSQLTSYKYSDVKISCQIAGKYIPEQAYLRIGNRRILMQSDSAGYFSTTLFNVQKTENIQIEAEQYFSPAYTLTVIEKPQIAKLQIEISYPSYTNKKQEKSINSGNITVLEGSSVQWKMESQGANTIYFSFNNNTKQSAEKLSSDKFIFYKKVTNSSLYEISLEQDGLQQTEKTAYQIDVIKDAFPSIEMKATIDSISYTYIYLNGSIEDDYGFSKLKLFYKNTTDKNTQYKEANLKLDKTQNQQQFSYLLNLDSLKIPAGSQIEYFCQIWDNDGVNGAKSSKTEKLLSALPNKAELSKEWKDAENSFESNMSKTIKKAEELKKELIKAQNKLKSKKDLSWQDKKSLEDLIKKQKDLQEAFEQRQKELNQIQEQKQRFNEQDPVLTEKAKQLQELMKEILDEKTKKLYEELQKLLNEKKPDEALQMQLDKIQEKEAFLEKDLDRSIKMFKNLKFKQDLEKGIKDLEKLADEQEKLADESLEKKSDKNELQEKQEDVSKKFDDIKTDLKDLEKQAEELNKKDALPEDSDKESKEISDEQEKSSEELSKDNKKEASKSQKEASKKMKKMASKMKEMEEKEEKEESAENIEDLRNILENLLLVSFDQEDILKGFKKTQQSDPAYLGYSQKQLKLKDDTKIIEDSLYALGERVFQIKSFITKELGEIKFNINESITAIKQRRPDMATSRQQFSMTSINNLALMLSEVLAQMQEEQQPQKTGKGKMKIKKKCKNGDPKLSDMQKELSKKIQDLQSGKMSGMSMSKELAKLAAQQQMLRNALKSLEDKSGEKGGEKPGEEENGGEPGNSSKLKDISKKMEENEKDLVNKKITAETILRQNEITTRLLEAEKAQRERDEEPTRESKTGKELERKNPPKLEDYLKNQERQIELIRSIPIGLNPYYLKETTKYFKKLQNSSK